MSEMGIIAALQAHPVPVLATVYGIFFFYRAILKG